MLLCSIEDVQRRVKTSLDERALLDLIESVSDEIEDYVGAWLAPRPDGPGELTMLFDVERAGSTLRLQVGDRTVGIRTLSALGYATTGQAETGGTFTTIPLANALLRPRPSTDGPASSIVLTTGTFYRGFNTITATGTFGPASVAPRVRDTAIERVSLDLANGRNVQSEQIGQWSVTYADSRRAEILSRLDSLLRWAV